MATKLYSQFKDSHVQLPVTVVSAEAFEIDDDIAQLNNHVEGLVSVGKVFDSVATESLLFVDTKNQVLYNEYVTTLSKRLGIAPKTVSDVALETQSVQSVNYELSLEGWMKDIWEKIKGFFTKIYEAVKGFFKTYFTRLGRLKNKLDNLENALKKTDKDLKQSNLESPPSGLMSKFNGFPTVSESVVKQSLDNFEPLMKAIADVNKDADAFTKKDIVGSKFVATIKAFKDQAAEASKQIETNNENKKDTKFFSKARKEINEDNKSLTQIKNESEREAKKGEDQIANLGELDLGDLESNRKEAQTQYEQFVKKVSDHLKAAEKKQFAAGMILQSVTLSDNFDVEVDLASNSDTPEGCSLCDKAGLLSLISTTKNLIKTAEDDVSLYSKVNDEVMKQLRSVDSLISDIDRVDPEKFGKYKKVLNENIRHRLGLLKNFFGTYNKTGKAIFDLSMSTGDGVVEYSVVSMKYFG